MLCLPAQCPVLCEWKSRWPGGTWGELAVSSSEPHTVARSPLRPFHNSGSGPHVAAQKPCLQQAQETRGQTHKAPGDEQTQTECQLLIYNEKYNCCETSQTLGFADEHIRCLLAISHEGKPRFSGKVTRGARELGRERCDHERSSWSTSLSARPHQVAVFRTRFPSTALEDIPHMYLLPQRQAPGLARSSFRQNTVQSLREPLSQHTHTSPVAPRIKLDDS